jgi:hypothetical protein
MNVFGITVTQLVAAAVAVFSMSAAAGPANGWSIEVVDASGPGKFSTLKVDKSGNVHIAYIVDDDYHTLKYAYRDSVTKRWFSMALSQGASFCDLALDSKQFPHISYADFGTTSGAGLHHVYWDGSEWHNLRLPLNSDVVGYYTSIVLDTRDYPSISFYEYRGPKGTEISVRMRVVSWNGKYWEVLTIDGDNQSGKFNSMATDAQGNRYLAYANVSAITAGVRYAYLNGRVPTVEVVDDRSKNDTELVGHSLRMAVDKNGTPHLTYVNYSRPAVKYAVRKDGHWLVQTIEPLVGTAYPDRNSIAVDEQGRPYVGYFDPGRGSLRLAHRDQDKWAIETVDINGSGFTSSLQVDQGVIWMSYADETAGSLKVAMRDLHSPILTTAGQGSVNSGK